ncbi:MAG TPA: BspA family leucine-rich repeat surface protein, partial [Clostridiales bacterium]|nr:BspA family leucine-rich repeat surface protein [Clostridiales bacterium]
MNKNKGFTLIELLIVIVILSILVLLAGPRFLGQTQKAFTTSIIHDAKLIQEAAEQYHLDNDEYPFMYEEDENGGLVEVEAGSPSQYEILHKTESFEDDNPNVKFYEIDFRKLDTYLKLNNDEGYFVAARGNPQFGITALKPGVTSTQNRLKNVIDDKIEDKIPNYYQMAENKDFKFIKDSLAPNIYNGTKGYYKYVGTKEYIIIPHTINGVEIKDYYKMFEESNVKGMVSDNKNITNMNGMFRRSKSITLDLLKFDTSNVTNMHAMFWNSQATTLDLSTFDTSNVTNMSNMFQGSKATTLNISSFNTSNVTNMGYMFYGCKSTILDLSNFDTNNVKDMSHMFGSASYTKYTIYVKTQQDVDKFSGYFGSPSIYKFIV